MPPETGARPALVPISTQLMLDRVGDDMFRSRHNQPNVYKSLFGGQIVGQALTAADATVAPGRTVHSLHAYFLRRGDGARPIGYAVERERDGARFSTRRVRAHQGGPAILTMTCSYRVPLDGFSHSLPPGVDNRPDEGLDAAALKALATDRGMHYNFTVFNGHYPVEMRFPSEEGYLSPAPGRRHYWLRAPGCEDIADPAEHARIFAYLSDFAFAGVALTPHTLALAGPHIFIASLDHSIWFHRPLRCDDWLLFVADSPSAQGGVNLSRGTVYDRTGTLVASIAQEALQQATDDAAAGG